MLYQKKYPHRVGWLKFCLFLLLFLVVWQSRVQSTQAATLQICLSGCPYSIIQDAINDADNGDVLEFTTNKEIFLETISINNKSLTFMGQTTTINAQDGGTAVTISGSPTVTMHNMIIQNGNVEDGNGAGIRLNGGDLTLTDVTLNSNDVTGNGSGSGLGGALYIANSSSEVSLSEVTIQTGTAVSGGAIYNVGVLTADNLTLLDNAAVNGAGIFNNGTALLSDLSAARRNDATEAGGGFFNASGADLTLINAELSSNTASDGAGIYNAGILQLTETNIGSGNDAAATGGGLYNNSTGQATLSSSAVFQNEGDSGAGIYNAGTLTATNTTISRNVGPDNQPSINGPGLYNESGTATLNNVTIHLTIGTSIFANGGTVTVGNTIISSITGESACGGGGTFSSSGYNLSSDLSCSFLSETKGDIQGVDPDLNGITSPSDSTAFHSPKLSSAVIDAGNPATPNPGGVACLTNDQRGLSRPQSRQCDIGAVEIVVYRIYVPLATK